MIQTPTIRSPYEAALQGGPPKHKPWLFAPTNVGPFEINRAGLRHPETLRKNAAMARVRHKTDPRRRAAARCARIARRAGR